MQQILGQAAALSSDDRVSREQLFDIAAEMGISAETLRRAESAWLERQATAQKQARRRARQQLGFQMHSIPYIFVSILLVLLNLSTTPRCIWSIYPILGWGL
jgi:hypothetical protein